MNKTAKTFEPAVIGGIKVKNRLFRSATSEGFAAEKKVTPKLEKVYSDLSDGNVGLMIIGYTTFSKSDYNFGPMLSIENDTLANLKELVEKMHQNDTKMVVQLNHSSTQLFADPGAPVMGPSEYTDPLSQLKATAMTVGGIKELVKEFGQAAAIAKEA